MTEPLDRAKVRELLDLTGGDPTWLHELYATYLDDTRGRLDALRGALAGGGAEAIQREAHGIKGASANVGATEVARLCGDIEHLARQGDVLGARAAAVALDEVFDRVRADVPRVLGPG
ncbi:MAG: Hpt domain-containing protein [Alphaproteobacteria bacterium]|nr:Hpt domain-containing protein [Alphaproteobacteria bacterium]